MDSKEKLRNQISDSAGNVLYTYSAHWNIVNRIKKQYFWIKIVQIVLTATSAGGFLATILSGIPDLSWICGLTSVVALALNLYMLNFNPAEDIKKHSDAANELWAIREAFKSLEVDFDDLPIDSIREKRDILNQKLKTLYDRYPGTDERSFRKTQSDIGKYVFDKGESQKLMNINVDNVKNTSDKN